MKILGFILLISGLIWMIAIMGGVFSHKTGFTSLVEMLPGLAFHAVSMALGMFLITRAPKKTTQD